MGVLLSEASESNLVPSVLKYDVNFSRGRTYIRRATWNRLSRLNRRLGSRTLTRHLS